MWYLGVEGLKHDQGRPMQFSWKLGMFKGEGLSGWLGGVHKAVMRNEGRLVLTFMHPHWPHPHAPVLQFQYRRDTPILPVASPTQMIRESLPPGAYMVRNGLTVIPAKP